MSPEKPSHLTIRWSGLTNPGRYRRNNEDAFLGLMFDDSEVRYLGKEGESSTVEGDFIFAVSDGMGGANAGEFASRIAVQKITELLPHQYRRSESGPLEGFERTLFDIIIRIHTEMIEMGRHYEECRGMGATLSLVWISPGYVYLAHVGDSRIYHLPAGQGLKQISKDQSYVGRMRQSGKISEREARMHSQRNVLDQVLGGHQQRLEPQIEMLTLGQQDTFALCTDGVSDGVWERGFEELLCNPPQRVAGLSPAGRLVKEAYDASGRDNITALVVECARADGQK